MQKETTEIQLGHLAHCTSHGTAFCSCSFEQNIFNFREIKQSWLCPVIYVVDECDCGMVDKVNLPEDKSIIDDLRKMTEGVVKDVTNDPYTSMMKRLKETKKIDSTMDRDIKDSIVKLENHEKSEFSEEILKNVSSSFCSHCSFKIYAGYTEGLIKIGSDDVQRKRSRLYLTASADSGNPFAQYLLGVYHFHLGTYSESYLDLMNLPTGPFIMGKKFDFIKGCSTNKERDEMLKEMRKSMAIHLKQAYYWFQKSACQGFLNSILYLAHMSLRSCIFHSMIMFEKWMKCAEFIDPESSIFLYFRGVSHLVTKTPDKSKALDFFIRSGQTGCAASIHEIYRLTKEEGTEFVHHCSTCNHVDKNRIDNLLKTHEDTARKWLKKAADLGYSRSLHEMGCCLTCGIMGYKKDVRASTKYYLQACELGNVVSMSVIGSFFQDGQYITKDDKIAFEWFLMAALNGINLARVQVALMFKLGLGVQKNIQQCLWWLSWASVEGFGLAILEMGRIYLEVLDDWKMAYEFFQKAATTFSIGAAYYFMGQMLLHGKPGAIVKDVKKARLMWQKAKDLGNLMTISEPLKSIPEINMSLQKEQLVQAAGGKVSKKKKKKANKNKKNILNSSASEPVYMGFSDDALVLYDSATHDLRTPKKNNLDKISLCYMCGHYRDCFEKGGTTLKHLKVCSKCSSVNVVVCETKANANVRVGTETDYNMVECYFLHNSSESFVLPWLYGRMERVGDFCLVNASLFGTEKFIDENGAEEHVCNVKIRSIAYTAYPVFLDILSEKTKFSRFSLVLRMIILQEMFLKHKEISKNDFSQKTVVFSGAGEVMLRNFVSNKTYPPLTDLLKALDLMFPEKAKDDFFVHLKIQLKEGVDPLTLVHNHPFFCRSEESLLMYMETALTIKEKLMAQKHELWRQWVLDDCDDELLLDQVNRSNDTVFDMVNFCCSLKKDSPKETVKKILRWIPDFFISLYFCYFNNVNKHDKKMAKSEEVSP